MRFDPKPRRPLAGLLVLVAVDHDRTQRGTGLGLRGEIDPSERILRGERFGRADRETGAAEQPGEMHDIRGEGGVGHQGGGA